MPNLSSSDYQNILYSVLLLTVFIVSMMASKQFSFSKLVKYLSIWSLIILLGIIIYSFRFEFFDLKNRVIGAINPTAARINQQGQIVIELAQDGHFYIDLKINQKLIRFMVDTGASSITINANDAKSLGINIKNLTFNKRYETANGTIFGAPIMLEEIEIAGIKFNNIAATINSADLGVSLLGMDFLRKFRKYEFYQDKLILTL